MIIIIAFLILLWIALFYLIFLMYTIQKPKIELRKSNIHNRGVFTNQYIKNGDIIEKVPLISYVSKDVMNTILNDYVISMPQKFNNENKFSVMLGYGSIYNHSDKNNAEWHFK